MSGEMLASASLSATPFDSNRSSSVIDLTADNSAEDDERPLASSSRAPPPRAHAPRRVVEVVSDDEDVVEVDRDGQPVPPRMQSPLPRRTAGLPIIVGPNHPNTARPRRHPHLMPRTHIPRGLHILDPAPPPRHLNVPEAARDGPRVGFGGAILALRTRRTPRAIIGYAPVQEPYYDLLGLNEDGGGDGPAHRYSLHQILDSIRAQANGIFFNWGEPPQPEAAALQDDTPAFDPSFIHITKNPRPGFTYDFDRVPDPASWKPIAPSSPTTPSVSAFTDLKDSVSTLLGTKRKATTVIDLANDDDDAASDDSSANLPTLLCAGCDTALMLGLDGDDRVWGLRCGHLICGSCLNRIGTPLPPKPKTLNDKLDEVLLAPSSSLSKSRAKGKGKGKGKARQMSFDQDPSLAYEPPSSPTSSAAVIAPEPSVSRYATLRPRRGAAAREHHEPLSSSAQDNDHHLGPAAGPSRAIPLSTAPFDEAESDADDAKVFETSQPPAIAQPSRPIATATRGRKKTAGAGGKARSGKRKGGGAGKTRERKLREWEYACPVEGCHRIHARVLVGPNQEEAVWKPKGDLGEIAVYMG